MAVQSIAPVAQDHGAEDWLTVQELSEQINVREGTIHKWVQRGEAPPHYRLGRLIRFRAVDVEIWLRTRRRES